MSENEQVQSTALPNRKLSAEDRADLDQMLAVAQAFADAFKAEFPRGATKVSMLLPIETIAGIADALRVFAKLKEGAPDIVIQLTETAIEREFGFCSAQLP